MTDTTAREAQSAPLAPKPEAVAAPILVIGAHRSGTSAVARVLDALGVFPGAQLDDNHESLFFQRLNEWVLAQCGARWDNPRAIDHLLDDHQQRALAISHLRSSVASPRSMAFLGRWSWLRGRRIGDGAQRFCFKDPRTTFTLPLWLAVFPNARIIHVHRHGVDVAQSLCVRHRRRLAESQRRFQRNRSLLAWLPKRAGFGDSPRLSSLQGAFDLWEEYFVRARGEVLAHQDVSLEIAYEELVRDGANHVDRLVRHCALDVSLEAKHKAALLLVGSRAEAWREDPELCEFARQVDSRVRSLREGITAKPAVDTVANQSRAHR